MLEVARTGETSDPQLVRISLARAINLRCGGVVITPWDDDLFQYLEITGWLDWFRALQSTQPRQTGMQKIEARKRAIFAKHPTYRIH